MTRARLIGSAVKRVEDPRLMTGAATYIGDLAPVGMLHAYFVRSQYAHARLIEHRHQRRQRDARCGGGL